MDDRWKDATTGEVPLSKIDVPENFWGARAGEVIDWLAMHYDPSTMPSLQVATIAGGDQDRYTLLGWKHEGTPWQPLLFQIFGDGYANAVLEQTRAGIRDTELKRRLDPDRLDPLDGSHRGGKEDV